MYCNYLNNILQICKDNSITIMPHDSADVDSIISSILLSRLFNFFNITNNICILDRNIGKDTKNILADLGYDVKDFFVESEDKNRKLFLLDHYETCHSGEVIGIIDHHFTTSNIESIFYLYKESSATAYIIYKLMEVANIPIDRNDIILLAYAMLVDTSCFKSPKTIESEKDELRILCLKNNLNFEKIKESSLALTDIMRMSVHEIIQNGLKKYTFSGKNIQSSYVQITGDLNIELLEKIFLNITKQLYQNNVYLWIFIVFDMEQEKTKVYYVTKDSIQTKIYDAILSRGKNIIPEVEEYFKSCKL